MSSYEAYQVERKVILERFESRRVEEAQKIASSEQYALDFMSEMNEALGDCASRWLCLLGR